MRFAAVLKLEGKSATGIPVPEDYVQQLDGGKRPAVVVTIAGRYSYRSTVMPYAGQAMLPVAAEHREAAGLVAGELVEVVLELDTQPRTVELPPDLAQALDTTGARAAFERLPPSHQKAHVQSVLTAKTDETRARRVAKVVEAITAPK